MTAEQRIEMSGAKCLLNVPTSKRIRLVPTLLVRQRASEVDGGLPIPPPIHSPHLNYPGNSLLERIHLIPHIFISDDAYHGIHKRHILHAQIRLQPYVFFQEKAIQSLIDNDTSMDCYQKYAAR